MEEHENCVGDNCKICEGYELFKECIGEGFEDFDAFHDVVAMVLEDFAEVLIDTMEGAEISQGYILAMRDIAENVTEVADRLEKDMLSEDSNDIKETMLIEGDLDEYETEKTIYIEGELSDDEIADIVSRVSELSGDGDIEIVNVECGVDCGCEPITCLFDEYDEDEVVESGNIFDESLVEGTYALNDGFVYGQEFVEWMKDKL